MIQKLFAHKLPQPLDRIQIRRIWGPIVEVKPVELGGLYDSTGMVVGCIIQEQINLTIAWMLRTQLGQEDHHLILIDILGREQKDVFLGLDAIGPEDIVPLTARVGRNQVRFALHAPRIASLGVVLEMHRIAKVDAIVGPQSFA